MANRFRPPGLEVRAFRVRNGSTAAENCGPTMLQWHRLSFRHTVWAILVGALFFSRAAGADRVSAQEREAATRRFVSVAQNGTADVTGSDSAALQRAMNRLRPGDVLTIGPGTYRMENSLFVPSGVTVRGTKGLTVLRKSAGVESALIEDGDYGETRLIVAEPAKFRVGMGLAVTDDLLRSDWDVSVATVIAIEGNTLRISPRLLRDYSAERHQARIKNTFPLLCAIDAENVLIEDLIVDGNKAENAFLDGCRGGAIYLYQSNRVTIRNCVARDYNGDGISFQITEDIQVLNSEASGNTSHGLHPGAGSLRPLVRDCSLSHNARVGLFLCWRVQDGDFERNAITHNGEHGISIGHKDTDNRFVENSVARNGVAGVFFREETFKNSGHRNIFKANMVTDNGTAEQGYGFFIAPHVAGIELHGNRIADTRPPAARTQRYGLYRATEAKPVLLADNQMSGHLADEYLAPGRP
jgi:parallel beta-helix repeat protein